MNRAARRRLEAIERRVANSWVEGRRQLGFCAVCAQRLRRGDTVQAGEFFFAEGCVLVRIHETCAVDLKTDPAIARRVTDEAWRSLFGAGPDDVAGAA